MSKIKSVCIKGYGFFCVKTGAGRKTKKNKFKYIKITISGVVKSSKKPGKMLTEGERDDNE